MPSHNTHRIVIIGIGAVAQAIAHAIAQLPNATLVAGACRTRAKGEAFAREFACRWYPDTDEMLDRERPDVAVVATPSGTHLEHVAACARRGIHVLCEKPLEITTARIRAMIDAAEQGGIVLGGIFPQRFKPVSGVLHDAAAAGRFGPLAVVSAAVPWWRDDAYYGPGRWQGTAALDGGGALMNQAIHSVDLVQWLAAATMPDLPPDANPVEEVVALTARRSHDPNHIEVEDTAVALLRFRNGALGQLLAATSTYPGSLRRMLIGGRDGTAELYEDQLLRFHFRDARPEDDATRAAHAGQTRHAGGAGSPMAFDYANHQRNLAAFLDALDAGRPPALSARESAKAVAIIEACYASARTARPVRL